MNTSIQIKSQEISSKKLENINDVKKAIMQHNQEKRLTQDSSQIDMQIKVCQAHIQIEDGSTFYRLDPFVTITCMDSYYHTDIARLNGFMPTWNQHFRIKDIQNLDENILIQVYRCPSKSLNQRGGILIGQRRLMIREFLPD